MVTGVDQRGVVSTELRPHVGQERIRVRSRDPGRQRLQSVYDCVSGSLEAGLAHHRFGQV
jgi:hypothetical protein